jgi:heat shock protein HtpX
MAWIKRIGLFFFVNMLIMVTVGVVWSILGQYFGVSGYTAYLVVFSGVAGFGGALFSLWTSKWMAKSLYGVKIIDPLNSNPQFRTLVEKVHQMARSARLAKMPEVGVYDSADINAFATGPSKSNSMVAVSSGLLYSMNEQEVEGVLAHEVSHIANGDMVTMTLIQGIVNTFSLLFSRLLANLISSQVEEKSRSLVYFVCTIIGDILFTLLGSIVVSYYSRSREFRADAGGAQLSSRSSMILALRKLQMMTSKMVSETESQKDALATLKINHPQSGGLASLFMTHPPLEVRILALEKGR